jgi:DNA invertase Pin-like site-specific DNA recombinase
MTDDAMIRAGTQASAVEFASLTEALDLTTPAGRAMAELPAVFAALEREMIGERMRAGVAHAQQNGKRLGRPQPQSRIRTRSTS